LGVIGRYILQPEVMAALDRVEPGSGGEIQLTDALASLVGTQPFHAVTVDAQCHDCGDKLGFVLANLALGLADPEIGDAVRAYASSSMSQ
jgi:UTP--glucose-1-phosphate uridylyltransferase